MWVCERGWRDCYFVFNSLMACQKKLLWNLALLLRRLLTLSTVVDEEWCVTGWLLLKLTMISLVFLRFRLLVLHQSTRCFTSSPWAVLLSSRIRATTIVSSANFTMWLVVDLAQNTACCAHLPGYNVSN